MDTNFRFGITWDCRQLAFQERYWI